MINIEFVMENGAFNKNNPLTMDDEIVAGAMKDYALDELETYEDLCDYKDKHRILTSAYNALWCHYVQNTHGESYSGRIAIVAYDDAERFPVWIAVADNRFGKKLKYNYYEPNQQQDRREFSWAIKRSS